MCEVCVFFASKPDENGLRLKRVDAEEDTMYLYLGFQRVGPTYSGLRGNI